MRKNGLEKPENGFNSDATVADFRQECKFHPQFLQRAVEVVEDQIKTTEVSED